MSPVRTDDFHKVCGFLAAATAEIPVLADMARLSEALHEIPSGTTRDAFALLKRAERDCERARAILIDPNSPRGEEAE